MSKVKLHFGHVMIRLFRLDIGGSLERQSLKHGPLPFKYFSGQSKLLGKLFKKVLKKQQAIK